MYVLSLFDGCSCAKISLDQTNIDCEYFTSEIDPYAEAVSKYHFNVKRLGDIRTLKPPKVDLIIGGCPCQGLSLAKANRQGLRDTRSALFFEYVRILDLVKPKFFIMENVASMRIADRDTISSYLGVQPVKIDSALLTCQMRKRYYWCNFPVNQPKDLGITLQSILECGTTDRDKSYCIDAYYYGLLTPLECERCQGIPDQFTSMGDFGKIKPVSNKQRYKMIGNAFTVPVIKHILEQIHPSVAVRH